MELSQRINISLPTDEPADSGTGAAQPGDTFGRVAQLIAEVTGIDAELVTEESTSDSLGVDSLSRIEVTVRAEEAFGVRIDAAEAEGLATVGDLVAYLADHE